jgi:plastocyanin
MTRSRRVAIVGGAVLVLALGACGEAPTAAAPNGAVTFFPSTPIPTPGPAAPSASVAATAAAPQGVGQASNSGLGSPAERITATAGLSFDPASTTAKVGDVIQWTNTGDVPHNVTFDSQPSLTSGTLSQGNTWQVKFTTAGTYSFHCTFHPGMNGQITVGG